MAKNTGEHARTGDWHVWCSRGHKCWASEVYQTSCGTFLCKRHWEPCLNESEQQYTPGVDDVRPDVIRGESLVDKRRIANTACPRTAIVGIAIVGCAIVGVGQEGVPHYSGEAAQAPDPNKPSTFTTDTGTISLG